MADAHRTWFYVLLGCALLTLLSGCSDEPSPSPTPAMTVTPTEPALPTVTRIDQNLPGVAFVTSVAQGPDGRWWAGVFDRTGLYVSEDNGGIWTPAEQVLPNWQPTAVYDFLRTDDALLIASERGLFGSDGERVWETGAAVYDLTRDTRDGDTLYAASPEAGLWRRQNRSWQQLPSPAEAMLLSVAAHGDWLIVGTSGAGAYQSTDSGQTWTQLPDTAEDYVSVVLTLDEGTGFVRTKDNLLHTTDNGQTWEDVSPANRVFDLRYDGSRLYAALRAGGVVVSDNLGETWQELAPGLVEARETLAIARTDGGGFLAGTRDGVYHLANANGRWQRTAEELGRTQFEALTRITDTDGAPVLLAGHLNGLYRSTDGGETWTFSGDDLDGTSVVAFAQSPWDERIFAGTFGGGLWVSSDAGATWDHVETAGALNEQSLLDIYPDPDERNRLFTRVAYERVYESTDAGSTWQPRWEGLGRVVEVFSFEYDPHTSGRLYAGGHDGLFRSDSDGTRWQRVAPSLTGQSVLALHADPRTENRLWIGTTRGLYVSDDAGETVQPTAIQNVTVQTLDGGPTDETLLVGTQHSGLWWPTDAGWEQLPDLAERTIVDIVWQDERTALVATDDGLYSVRGSAGAVVQGSRGVEGLGSVSPRVSPSPHLPSSPSPAPAFHLLNPTDALFKAAAENDARAVVVVFPWREIEPNQNEFHWEDTDAWVRAAEYYDLDLIVRLDQTPDWAIGEATDGDVLNAPPADIVDWADFVRRVSTRYSGRIAGYVVWNEPNLTSEWGNQPPDPAGYVELLRVAHDVILGNERQGGSDGSAEVVAAGLAMTNQTDGDAIDEREYLQAMYDAGAQRYLTALAAHPYGFGRPPDAPQTTDDALVFRRLDDLRAIMQEYDDGDTPIWVTEYGWPTEDHPQGQPAVTPAEQAQYLADAYQMLAERDWVTLAAAWHLGQDLPADDEKAGFNLLTGAGGPMPALQRLRDIYPAREVEPQPVPPVALGPDVKVHLGDSELPPPWWPLYQGINPSVVWEGGFYLTEVPESGTLYLEIMQHNEPGSAITVNGQNVLARPLPAEDFSAKWVAYRLRLTRQHLQVGYNRVEIRAGRLLPDFHQRNFVWDDMMIRNARFIP